MQRRAFSMIEVTVAMLIVAGLLVAALETIGSTASGRRAIAQRAAAAALAQDLLEEIRTKRYAGTADVAGSLGPTAAESVAAARAAFDDIDDYDGWSETPPVGDTGTPLPGFTGWTRSVTVRFANPTTPGTDSVTDQRVKRIEVTVRPPGGIPFTLVALRSQDADLARP